MLQTVFTKKLSTNLLVLNKLSGIISGQFFITYFLKEK